MCAISKKIKICSICKIEQPIINFGKYSKSKDGIFTILYHYQLQHHQQN